MSDHDRDPFEHDPIHHAEVPHGASVGDLARAYGDAGIGAADVHDAVRITAEMFREDASIFLGLAGPMVPGGMGRVVTELIREERLEAIVTTGATVTHDTIEAIGGSHHHGHATERGPLEREHDEALREAGIDRIYNVYLPQEHFTAFEGHLREHVFPSLTGEVAIHELTRTLGEANAAVSEQPDPGIAAAAAEHDIPVYCPAVEDSILGIQAWMYGQLNEFSLNPLRDMSHLNTLAVDATPAGAFVVGGGVPKNFVLQARLVTPEAYTYGVQLTMDPPATGGLSGATLNEARSWGKLAPEGENATVYGDATITFPLVVAAAREWAAE